MVVQAFQVLEGERESLPNFKMFEQEYYLHRVKD
jgi:hypothetical protein